MGTGFQLSKGRRRLPDKKDPSHILKKKLNNSDTGVPHHKAHKLLKAYTLYFSKWSHVLTTYYTPPPHIQPAGKMAATSFLRDTTMLTGRNNGT